MIIQRGFLNKKCAELNINSSCLRCFSIKKETSKAFLLKGESKVGTFEMGVPKSLCN